MASFMDKIGKKYTSKTVKIMTSGTKVAAGSLAAIVPPLDAQC